MDLGRARSPWPLAVAVTAAVVLVGAGLVTLVAAGTDPLPVGLLATVAAAGLVAVLARLLGGRSAGVRRLAADTNVIVDANPAHRLRTSGTGELAPLAAAVNLLADEREAALHGAAVQAEVARRDVEAERNRLAALMAQLTVAVIVCNSEGRILLYNEAARSLLGDRTPVGLGRSVFGLVDRGLVTHAHDRLTSGSDAAYTATTLHGDQLLRVRLTLVPSPAARPSGEGGSAQVAPGYVLVLEDLTREIRAGDLREGQLRRLTQETRASLGSIRAAAESVLDFPELSPAEREHFLEIVREEADQLGRRLPDLAGDPAGWGGDRALTDIAGDDLLVLLENALQGVGCPVDRVPADRRAWLRADGYALAQALARLVERLTAGAAQRSDADALTLTLSTLERHGQVDVCWSGPPPEASVVETRLDEPLEPGGTTTARNVIDRHGAEVWAGAGEEAGTTYLRLLIPLVDADREHDDRGDGERAGAVGPAPSTATPWVHGQVASRPEYYDFDLFDVRGQSPELTDGRLDEVSFTVFDTETTGLDPAGGDRIISVGAVRVVNGRVLRQETFERLVDPGRAVPAASTAIHGITAEMVAGQPAIAEVLPAFARFAEDTVLVGHNVAFDLQFVELAGTEAGVVLSQPALDTLLLHAALHPDHHEHTLEAIAGRLGVSVVGRHTALGDALVTAEVFVALLPLLHRRGVDTVAEALTVAQRTYQARMSEELYGR